MSSASILENVMIDVIDQTTMDFIQHYVCIPFPNHSSFLEICLHKGPTSDLHNCTDLLLASFNLTNAI